MEVNSIGNSREMTLQFGRVILIWALVVSFVLTSIPVMGAPGPSVATRVEKHNQLGIQYYKDGKFPEAVREMLEAYRLIPDPGLLYNIAKIYAKMGETSLAITYFEKFVQSDEVDPANVEKALVTLQKLREKQRHEGGGNSTLGEGIELAPLPQKPSVRKRRRLKATPFMETEEFRWLILGSGAALLLGSGIFGLQVKESMSAFEKASGVKEKREYEGRAQGWALGADINMVAGILAVGFGGYLWWDAETSTNKQAVILPMVGEQYVGLQWTSAVNW
jgi:tetratricopeptide (TPR) repeat protein